MTMGMKKAMVHQTNVLSEAGRYALVILNMKLPKKAAELWKLAQLRVCADGGANRLFKEMPSPERFIPDYIIGDLDSIYPEVKGFYASKGVKILDKSRDQDTTDLHKCVSYIKHSTQTDNLAILVLGGLGGRFDHEMGNINVLYTFPDLRICLLNDHNLIFLLPAGFHHRILATPGAHCGLLPIRQPCSSSTTTGLRWNLHGTRMEFGSLISTSNVVEAETVTVESDSDLIWTMEL